MFKLRTILLSIGFLFAINCNAQKGFNSTKESADSLFNWLTSKKIDTINAYTVTLDTFKKEFKKQDSVLSDVFIKALYLSNYLKTQKSYKRLFKKIHKKPWSYKRLKKTNVDTYADPTMNHIRMIKITINQKKLEGTIIYYLWNIGDKWFFCNDFSLVY